MQTYKEQTFDLPDLKDISAKQVEVHLGLYGGYVKHVNLIREKLAEMKEKDVEGNAYAIAEVRRRFAFEFCGLRMHEYYFEQWEKNTQDPKENSALAKNVSEKYGGWNNFIDHFKEVAGGTRGIGWTVLYLDPKVMRPHITWVADHELGQLAGLPVILALDMWEHAYMVDYTPSEKKKYIEAFFDNLNWSVPETRFEKST